MVVYWPLEQVECPLNFPRGIWNTKTPKVANVVDILSVVGIWTSGISKKTYILQKHPALAMLSMEESGLVEEANTDEDMVDVAELQSI